jgi:hypothetical protein
MLLGDCGIEFTGDTADFDDPVQMGVVALFDALHTLHELRKRFELSPLVVNDIDRAVHVN